MKLNRLELLIIRGNSRGIPCLIQNVPDAERPDPDMDIYGVRFEQPTQNEDIILVL
jgi:hypothetical protein